MKSKVLLALIWIGIALLALARVFDWPAWLGWLAIAMIVIGIVVPQKKS